MRKSWVRPKPNGGSNSLQQPLPAGKRTICIVGAKRSPRLYLDGEQVTGKFTMSSDDREGTLCTLDGKVVRLLTLVMDESSGEIKEIHLAEVKE
jgi:hypothetical protein